MRKPIGTFRNGRMRFALCAILGAILLATFPAGVSFAKSALEIDTSVDVCLERFYKQVKGAKEFAIDHAEHISAVGGCEECHHQHRSMQVQSCSECHRIDPSFFKKNVNAGTLKPCGTCHPVSNRPGDRGRLELKTAYHQACFKCHKEEVAGKPKGCTGMCHVPKGGESREKKK